MTCAGPRHDWHRRDAADARHDLQRVARPRPRHATWRAPRIASITNVSYGTIPAHSGDSSARLATPTLADEMRAQLGVPPQVVTMSIKARSALTLAGHRSTLSTWFDGPRGFMTSPAMDVQAACRFSNATSRPIPSKPTPARCGQRIPAADAYLYQDSAPAKAARAPSFPIVSRCRRADGQVDPAFYGTWQMSPFADAYLGRMAAAAISDLELGKGPGTDFLAVSFSTLDTVGHAYGPRSHEVQDILARLDTTIGTLLEELDRQVGRDSYVLAFTSDHGVSPIPQQMQALGLGGGLVDRKTVATVLTSALGGSRPRQQHRLRDLPVERGGRETRIDRSAELGCAAHVAGAGRRHRTRLAHHGSARGPLRGRLRPDGARGAAERLRRAVPATSSSSPTRIGFLTGLWPRMARPTDTINTCRWCLPARSSGAAGTPRPPARPTSHRRWVGLLGVTLAASDGATRVDAFVAPPALAGNDEPCPSARGPGNGAAALTLLRGDTDNAAARLHRHGWQPPARP